MQEATGEGSGRGVSCCLVCGRGRGCLAPLADAVLRRRTAPFAIRAESIKGALKGQLGVADTQQESAATNFFVCVGLNICRQTAPTGLR
jgi:hypothetical protein